MAIDELTSVLRRGGPAPSFTLPAIDRDGMVSLSDYRGKSAVLLPKPPVTPQLLEKFRTTLVDPFNELVAPVPITEIATALNERDEYDMNATDWEELEQQWPASASSRLTTSFSPPCGHSSAADAP